MSELYNAYKKKRKEKLNLCTYKSLIYLIMEKKKKKDAPVANNHSAENNFFFLLRS